MIETARVKRLNINPFSPALLDQFLVGHQPAGRRNEVRIQYEEVLAGGGGGAAENSLG